MVFVLLGPRMESKPQKPPFMFTNPIAIWTDLAFKLWGFGKVADTPETPVAVAVIPTKDASAHGSHKQAKGKARGKSRAKLKRR